MKKKPKTHLGSIMRKAKVHTNEDKRLYNRRKRKKLTKKEIEDAE